MIELSIPEIGEDSRNVKDLVFTILTVEQPLSLIELSNRIKKQYNLSITYQAVRKAVDNLVEKRVLIKEGKKYSIDKRWIMNLKSFFDKLLAKYESGKRVHEFTAEMAKENYAVYTFNNLLDLDNFWGDVMMYWAEHLKKGDNNQFFGICHYSWFFLINLGRETKIFELYLKRKVNSKMVFLRDYPLNHWGAKLYRQFKVQAKTFEDKKTDILLDMTILGDTVIQVKYPLSIRKKLKKFYEKYKTTQEMSSMEITQIAHEQCEIKFIVFKNPTIAKNIYDNYLKFLK